VSPSPSLSPSPPPHLSALKADGEGEGDSDGDGDTAYAGAGVENDILPGGSLSGWDLHVLAINSVEHLRGLKRTGGGVGSSKFHEDQTRIDSFFSKKRRQS